MAVAIVTGPSPVYVGLGTSAAPLLLGTCEQSVRLTIDDSWEPVINDVTGPRKAYTMQYMGKDGGVSGVLTVYNWAVWKKVLTTPNPTSSTFGTTSYLEMGMLSQEEGCTYPVWVGFPYSQKTFFSGNNLIKGLKFSAGVVMGPTSIDAGTKAQKQPFNIFCNSVYDPTSGNSVLCDASAAALAPISVGGVTSGAIILAPVSASGVLS